MSSPPSPTVLPDPDHPQPTGLWHALRPQRARIGLGAVLSAGHQTCEALIPVVLGLIIDRAVATGDPGALLWWLAALIALYLCLSFSFRFSVKTAETASQRTGHRVRATALRRILHPVGGAETGRLPGDLANVATSDAARVGRSAVAISNGIGALAGLITAAVVLLRASLVLGLVILIGLPLLLWGSHLLSKPLQRRSSTEQEQSARALGVAADLATGLRIIKGLGAETAAIDRYREVSRDSLAATLRAARAEAWQTGLMLTLTGAFIVIVALVGGRLAIDGQISLGQLVAAVGIVLFLIEPLQSVAWANAQLAQGRASAARIDAVLTAAPKVDFGSARPPDPVRGRLRLRGVRGAGLDGIDLHADSGELLAVAASDPAEAQALLDCLGRHIAPDDGLITLDELDISTMDLVRFRELVMVSAHNAQLFTGTVASNVGGRSEQATTAAFEAATVTEVVKSLPAGADTPIGDDGAQLSGGQRQRVVLARALAGDAPVVVLHDPTTAVDTATEARIAVGIREARRGRTTILVATSPALLSIADRVAFLHEGRILDCGSHSGLLERQSAYRELVLA